MNCANVELNVIKIHFTTDNGLMSNATVLTTFFILLFYSFHKYINSTINKTEVLSPPAGRSIFGLSRGLLLCSSLLEGFFTILHILISALKDKCIYDDTHVLKNNLTLTLEFFKSLVKTHLYLCAWIILVLKIVWPKSCSVWMKSRSTRKRKTP